jgi:hypothetical protein
MNCHIIMTAYMDDDVGDDITIPIYLLTTQYQRWAIFSLFSAHLQSILSSFTFCFQPIFKFIFLIDYYSTYNIQPIIISHTTNI